MATRGCTSSAASKVAQVCRTSCTVICRTAALAHRVSKRRLKFRGSKGVPTVVVNTRPVSLHRSPAAARAAAWTLARRFSQARTSRRASRSSRFAPAPRHNVKPSDRLVGGAGQRRIARRDDHLAQPIGQVTSHSRRTGGDWATLRRRMQLQPLAMDLFACLAVGPLPPPRPLGPGHPDVRGIAVMVGKDQGGALRAGSGAPRAGLWPWPRAPPGASAPSQPMPHLS